jgi:hypothetical protein
MSGGAYFVIRYGRCVDALLRLILARFVPYSHDLPTFPELLASLTVGYGSKALPPVVIGSNA